MTRTKNANGAAAGQRSASTFGPANRVRRGLAGLTHDAITLAELQAQLFWADAGQLIRKSKLAAILIAIAAVLALSSLPVLLFAAGWGLASLTELSLAVSLLLSAVVCGLIPAICLAWFGIRLVRSDLRLLDRSRGELARNVVWFKETLRHQAGY